MYTDPSGNISEWLGFLALLSPNTIIVAGIIAIALIGIYYLAENADALPLPNIGSLDGVVGRISDNLDSFIIGLSLLIVSSITQSLSDLTKKQFEYHHIVPQTASDCEEARNILEKVGINLNSPQNIIIIDYSKHRHMHTDEYYQHVNTTIKLAYSNSAPAYVNRIRVEIALAELRWEIMTGIY